MPPRTSSPRKSRFHSDESTAIARPAKIEAMRRLGLWVVLGQAALVATFAVALRSGAMPLGVRGEWEWQRLRVAPEVMALGLAGAGVLLFSGFVALGFRSLSRDNSPRREGVWLAGLTLAAIVVQGVVQEGAPPGYGLSKWIIALHTPGSSGYYTVARKQMADPRRFLADYPSWITRQDALHVGTHPPGLFLVARATLSLMEANPGLSRSVVALSPPSVSNAIIAFRDSQHRGGTAGRTGWPAGKPCPPRGATAGAPAGSCAGRTRGRWAAAWTWDGGKVQRGPEFPDGSVPLTRKRA